MPSTTNSKYHDITILGGGLAGLTLTRQLQQQRPDASILVLEKRSYPVPEGAYKVGESTIEVGAHYLAEVPGLKKHLVEEQLPKFGLRFFFNNGNKSLANGMEVGLSEFFPAPGYQVDRGRLENFLAQDVADAGATFVQEAHIREIAVASQGKLHKVKYLQAGEEHEVDSRWIVDASGRAALLKRRLDLAESIDHEINAIWFRLGARLRIDQWCDDAHWQCRAGRRQQRWLSTNHFLGRGYWVWIIPLAGGATSIGIVADPRCHPLSEMNKFELAMDWLARQEPLCAAAIEPHRDTLQDFCALKHIGHSCQQVYSVDRWAITGEAGVFLDPLYSPGIDYIAIANTQICSLIDHELRGESIDLMAARFQGIFLALFHDNLHTYRDQYPLFGNPRVMSLKYVWDYALYWSFPALLYFNGKMTDPLFFSEMGPGIETLRDLNVKMQHFFREWDAVDSKRHAPAVFVDQNEIAILKRLNAELKDRLGDAALRARFKRNVKQLEELASEIVSRISRVQPALASFATTQSAAQPARLSEVFEVLQI